MENRQENIEAYSRLSANYNEAAALFSLATYLKNWFCTYFWMQSCYIHGLRFISTSFEILFHLWRRLLWSAQNVGKKYPLILCSVNPRRSEEDRDRLHFRREEGNLRNRWELYERTDCNIPVQGEINRLETINIRGCYSTQCGVIAPFFMVPACGVWFCHLQMLG